MLITTKTFFETNGTNGTDKQEFCIEEEKKV